MYNIDFQTAFGAVNNNMSVYKINIKTESSIKIYCIPHIKFYIPIIK